MVVGTNVYPSYGGYWNTGDRVFNRTVGGQKHVKGKKPNEQTRRRQSTIFRYTQHAIGIEPKKKKNNIVCTVVFVRNEKLLSRGRLKTNNPSGIKTVYFGRLQRRRFVRIECQKRENGPEYPTNEQSVIRPDDTRNASLNSRDPVDRWIIDSKPYWVVTCSAVNGSKASAKSKPICICSWLKIPNEYSTNRKYRICFYLQMSYKKL